MALTVTHTTAADGTFSATGATEWNRGHTLAGGTAGRITYWTSTSVLDDSANLTFGPTAGQGITLAAGSAGSAVNALNITQTWNFNTSRITGILANFTNTSSHVDTRIIDLQVGGSSLFNVDKAGNVGIGTGNTVSNPFDISFNIFYGLNFNGSSLTFNGTNGAGGTTIRESFSQAWGTGPIFTAGTATTNVAALSVTQTWNNAACATGFKLAITDTTSASGALPFQVLGGASATTNLFSLSKTGAAQFGASVSLPNSGAAATVGNAALVAGTVTVSTTAINTADIVVLTRKTSGGTLGTAITYTISDATSFTITSDSALDTSTFSWVIVKAH